MADEDSYDPFPNPKPEPTEFPVKREIIPPRDIYGSRSRTAEVAKRAGKAQREIKLCGKEFLAPDYYSWSSDDGAKYKTYFSYKYKNPDTCAKYEFNLVTSSSRPDVHKYATEHVYEIQLIGSFLRWMEKNDDGVAKRLTRNVNSDMCSEVVLPLLVPRTAWSNIKFGNKGDMAAVGSRPIDELVSQLSGHTRASEMFYLESTLNGMKAKMFRNEVVSPEHDTIPDRLALVAKASVLYDYLSHADVAGTFIKVSNRMRAFWDKMDQAGQKSSRDWPKTIQWREGYDRWETFWIKSFDQRWKDFKNALIADTLKDLDVKIKGSGSRALIALRDSINQQLNGLGDLSDIHFQIADDLLDST